MHSAENERLKEEVLTCIDRCGQDPGHLLDVLQQVHQQQGPVSPQAMQLIADRLAIPPAHVYSVLSFYPPLAEQRQARFDLRLCHGVSCQLADKEGLLRHVQAALEIGVGEVTADGVFSLDVVDCLGLCDQGPALVVNGRAFTHVTPERADEIIAACRQANGDAPLGAADSPADPSCEIKSDLLCLDQDTLRDAVAAVRSVPQATLASSLPALPALLDPERLTVGQRWALAAAAPGDKCVICNADAGYSGAFRDRILLRGHLDLVVAGMAIAAQAVGASRGLIYLPAHLADLRDCVAAYLEEWAGEAGGGQSTALSIQFRVGLGEHIGRQADALLAALHGERGEPALAGERGAYGVSATLVQDPATLARIAGLCARQSAWPTDLDAALAATPELYSVSGDCARPGLYEFAPTTTVADLLRAAAGGDARAVQIGGLAAPFTLAAQFDQPLGQSAAGDGAVIVYGPGRNLLEIARQILTLFAESSCGQCTPCRNGIPVLIENAEALLRGNRAPQSQRELCALAETIQRASRCPLGQAAPTAFLSLFRQPADQG